MIGLGSGMPRLSCTRLASEKASNWYEFCFYWILSSSLSRFYYDILLKKLLKRILFLSLRETMGFCGHQQSGQLNLNFRELLVTPLPNKCIRIRPDGGPVGQCISSSASVRTAIMDSRDGLTIALSVAF